MRMVVDDRLRSRGSLNQFAILESECWQTAKMYIWQKAKGIARRSHEGHNGSLTSR